MHSTLLPVAVLLGVSSLSICAQSSFRLIGTNIYDFAPVMSNSKGSPYTLNGTCERITADGVILSIAVTNWLPDEQKLSQIESKRRNLVKAAEQQNANSAVLGGTQDMLTRLSVANLMRKGLLNSPGAIMTLSPREKQIWYEMQGGDLGMSLAREADEVRRNLKPYRSTLAVALTNAPPGLVVGSRVRTYAIPVRVLTTEALKQITVFDAGMERPGPSPEHNVVLTVTQSGIRRDRNPQSK